MQIIYQENSDKLQERLAGMSRLFGTDGIRGLANEYPMTAEVAFNLGRAIGYYYRNRTQKTLLIGKDTRISGDMLESALVAGLCSLGINVYTTGVLTTPAVAYLAKYYQAMMGVVISASHNPYQDNGIKFFRNDGLKFDSQEENEIEDILIKEKYKKINLSTEMIGKHIYLPGAKDIYIRHIIRSIPNTNHLLNLNYRMVIDCANGASSEIIPELFDRLSLGMDIQIINNKPDGKNINQKCGSTSTSALQAKVKTRFADLGLAFDGDADRVLAVDEKGQIVDGDQMMAIYAHSFVPEGKLGNNKIIATCMSNLGFDEAIKKIGGEVIRTDVGDKYVLKSMLAENAKLGGEQSGHIIFMDYAPNGDGIMTAFQLLDALSRTTKKVSVQADVIKKYCQKLLNYQINMDRYSFLQDKQFLQIKKEMEGDFKNTGRILIRPSGTERKIRILLETKDQLLVDVWEKRLNSFFQSYFY